MAAMAKTLPAGLPMRLFFVLITLSTPVITLERDKFYEELFIKPFHSGHVMFNFQFTTVWNVSIADSASFTHYRLFPKSLGDVLMTYKVQELHLTQTKGLWRYEKWGYPPEDAPPGAELWVWFLPKTQKVDQVWAGLVNALSGLFCSSLNFMDSKSTIRPRWTFRPQGVASEGYSLFSGLLRYSALPNEIVCTENLTPWKKLLPCDSKIGLSTLFNAVKLYDAFYHSLGVHVRPICRDMACLTTAIELKQTLTVVFDPTIHYSGKQSWGFKALFDKMLYTQCPLASKSRIYVDVTERKSARVGFELIPPPDHIIDFTRGGEKKSYGVYIIGEQLHSQRILNLEAVYETTPLYGDTTLPPVYARRYITGYGLEKGGITCHVYNDLDENLTLMYMDTIPWFLRVYFNTLKIENEGVEIRPYKIHYVPGKDRSRPYQIEIVFRLKAKSVTKISLSFERAFLKWTEYPPDANHGFYVNSAVFSTVLPVAYQYTAIPQNSSTFDQSMYDNSTNFFLRVHTDTLLVSLPTPDFSMPYNVICLTCTVVAIAFGSLHNLTTRRFIKMDPKKKKAGLLQKVKKFFKRKGRSEDKTTDSEVKVDSNIGDNNDTEINRGTDMDENKSNEKDRSDGNGIS